MYNIFLYNCSDIPPILFIFRFIGMVTAMMMESYPTDPYKIRMNFGISKTIEAKIEIVNCFIYHEDESFWDNGFGALSNVKTSLSPMSSFNFKN